MDRSYIRLRYLEFDRAYRRHAAALARQAQEPTQEASRERALAAIELDRLSDLMDVILRRAIELELPLPLVDLE